MVLIRLEFSSSIFWIVAALAGGLLGPPGPLVVGGPAAGPLGPGGPAQESQSQPHGQLLKAQLYSSIPPGLFPPTEVGGWFAGSPEGAGLETGGEALGPGGPVSQLVSVLVAQC